MGSFNCFVIGDGALTIQCCEILLNSGHDILGVLSGHREMTQWATSRRVPVMPTGAEAWALLREKPFDYLFSIVNMQLLPKQIVALPRYGAINFHDGPLPRYAGVHATSWALINDETRHGVSWHAMGEVVDGGSILKQRFVDIAENETAYSLNVKCFEAGLQTFEELVEALGQGPWQAVEQDLSQRTYFGMYQRPPAGAVLDWGSPAARISALVRGLEFGPHPNPMGRAKLRLGEQFFLCPEVDVLPTKAVAPPGTVTEIMADRFHIATADQEIAVTHLLTLEGKETPIRDIVAQYALRKGDVLPMLDTQLARRISEINAKACKHEAFWLERLSSLQPVSLPYGENVDDRPVVSACSDRPATAEAVPDIFRMHLSVSPPGVCLAFAFALYLARLTGEQDIHLGIQLPEWRDELAGLEALFAEDVPLLLNVDLERSVWEQYELFLEQLDAVRQHGTFARDMVARYPALRHIAEQGLFSLLPIAVRIVDAIDDAHLDAPAVCCLYVTVDGEQWRLAFNENALDQERAHFISQQFATFLRGIADDEGRPMSHLPLLDEQERQRIVLEWNQTEVDFPADLCIHHMFEAQVVKTPDDIAVVCKGQTLTYEALNTRANRLGNHLRRLGVGPDTLVGLAMDRSVDMVVGLMGILKAGGAYVPLDPTYPKDRIAFMIENADINLLLTQAHLASRLPTNKSKIVRIDADWPAVSEESGENVDRGVETHHLAYVIYTSGSTGKPKGVMVEHRNVANFFTGMDACIDYEPGATWLAVTSLSFDISVLEIFWTLARGFKVVIYPGEAYQQVTATAPGSNYAGKAIDFSLFYFSADQGENPANKYRLLLEGAKFADQHGFSAVWTPERHFHEFGGLYPNPSVTSAALAMITGQVQLRSGSVVAPLHSPIRIAEEWSVVDNLSNGRAAVAFAAGWMPEDFVIRPEAFEARKAAMFNHIDTVRRLWRGEKISFEGPDGRAVPVSILPRPLQAELPVWVTTAGNAETYEMAGKIGANILTHLLGQSIEDVARKVALYRKSWRESGHDGRGHVSLMVHTFLSDRQDYVREVVRGPLTNYLRTAADLIKSYSASFPTFQRQGMHIDDVNFSDLSKEDLEAVLDFAFERYYETSGLFGTPASCLDMIDHLKAIDIDEVACLIDFGVPTDLVLENMQYLDALRQATDPLCPERAEEQSIPALMRRHHVTHFQCTPSMASMLLMDNEATCEFRSLKQWLVGGEAMSAKLAAQLRDVTAGKVVNMYGPTETTIWSTTFELNGQARSIPIGRPIANTEIYIVDQHAQPLPIGIAGELMIGGAGVVRGYLGRPELTAERFIKHPFCDEPGARLYRTGDLARYQVDGTIEFIGRLDHQVKIRGYRIELGEIEALLDSHPEVRESVVIAREDVPGDKRLVAYVTAEAGGEIDSSRLRDYLKARLPAYMVPSHILQLETLPQTPNKKIDRKALPPPERFRQPPDAPAEDASDELERQLTSIWEQVLGVQQIGVRDNFFDLGGHSLLTVRLLGQIQQTFGNGISLAAFFRTPTIEHVASLLRAEGTAESRQLESTQYLAVDTSEPVKEREKPIAVPKRIKDTLLSGLKNRLLQMMALYAPGAMTVRVWLHRLRGVKISDNVFIGTGVILETAYPQLVSIGRNVSISIRSVVIAHFLETAEQAKTGGGPSVRIEDDAHIGPGVIILPNVTIGRGAVVAAGSVVNQSIPPLTMVQGNPAKPIANCGIPLSGRTYEEFMSHLKPIDN